MDNTRKYCLIQVTGDYIMIRKITRELLDHLPSDLHRQIAIEVFVKSGEWVIEDHSLNRIGKEEKSA